MLVIKAYADRGNPEAQQSYRATPEAKGGKLTDSQYTMRRYAQNKRSPNTASINKPIPFSSQERLEQSQRLKQV